MFSINISILLSLFFIGLILSGISGLLFLTKRVPLGYIRFHTGIISLPAIVSLLALFNTNVVNNVGPLHLDSLAWFMAFFVLMIGIVIQRFSIRFLLGDLAYRKYFSLFTLITGSASVAWLSDDFRLLIVCWGITLLGLTIIISLNREWKVARVATTLSGRVFLISWLALILAIIWLFHITGSWNFSSALTNDNLAYISSWERTGINLLLILAVVIPAAQWPFQKWLIESVVAPTPVSAIMHAGIVNVGGIMLTRFSPMLNGDRAETFLLVFSSISVLIGTGISLVQVDYKRQLVGSTIAQMGFMLIQCALGAYLAAIIHLVLHGLFKATLFLQAGSAVHRYEKAFKVNSRSTFLWNLTGHILGLLTGVAYWLFTSGGSYHFVNAFILGWALSFSWSQLFRFSKGKIDRMAALILLGGSAIVYFLIHSLFKEWLQTAVHQNIQQTMAIDIIIVSLLILGSLISAIATRYPSSALFSIIYLWLVKFGEGRVKSTESHPKYLRSYLSEGGNRF